MKKIYDWDAKPCERNHTVADLKARKGKNMGVLSQTTANTAKEAKAASEAGIDLIMCNAENTKVARNGAPTLFLTAALALPDYPTQNDVLRGAFKAMKAGADSIYTARGPHIVELLAREDIPVMCHLGLVPRKSSWRGGLRAIGKDIDEAKALMQDFLDMESAGAFSVEAECIVSEVMTLINERTPLLTSSLGSGGCADIIYLFQRDICGEKKYAKTRNGFRQYFGTLPPNRSQNHLARDWRHERSRRVCDGRTRRLITLPNTSGKAS